MVSTFAVILCRCFRFAEPFKFLGDFPAAIFSVLNFGHWIDSLEYHFGRFLDGTLIDLKVLFLPSN